jgi:hypothetical protein
MAISRQTRKAVKGKQTEASPSASTEAAKGSPLNFKVSAEFRREFKTYAAQHNKKLNQLLYEAFAALKERHVD